MLTVPSTLPGMRCEQLWDQLRRKSKRSLEFHAKSSLANPFPQIAMFLRVEGKL